MSLYIHHVSGRLRTKSPILKNNKMKAAAVCEFLKSQNGVLASEANVITGSILIRYNEATTSADVILELLKKQGCIDSSAALNHSDRSIDQALSGAGEMFGKAVVDAVLKRLVERSATALVAGIL